MMAVDVKRLNSADPIDVTRCEAKSDKVRAERRLDANLLAAASMEVEGERTWYAIRVANRSEIDIRDLLNDSRIDAVVPIKQVPVKRRFNAPSRKFVHRPVLPRLVFVRLVPRNEAFAGLLRLNDVHAMVGSHVGPYPIGDREMNNFMELAQKGAFDERNTPTGLRVGSRVRVNVGPHADFEGVLEGYAKGRTARVMTWLFGQEMSIDVTLAHLEKVE